jgi:hypothetical protein
MKPMSCVGLPAEAVCSPSQPAATKKAVLISFISSFVKFNIVLSGLSSWRTLKLSDTDEAAGGFRDSPKVNFHVCLSQNYK